MSADWFYNHRGRLQGPFAADAVIEKIESGELGPDDLVYQVGEDKWKPISTIPRLAKAVPQPTPEEKKKAKAERQWVILERKKGKANKQLGPYSLDELKAMLSRGELKLSDYVWKTGMKEWYRVQAFSELAQDPVTIPETPTVPDIPTDVEQTQTITQTDVGEDGSESELGNVMEITYKQATAEEPIPEEAEGPELTKTKVDPRDAKMMETRVNYRIEPDALKKIRGSVDTGGAVYEFVRNLLAGSGLRYVLGSVAVIVFVVLARGAWKRVNELVRSTDEAQVEQEAEVAQPAPAIAPPPRKRKKPVAKVQAPVVPPPTAKPEPPKPTAEPRVPASFVRLKYDSSKGELIVQTDASSHFATELRFTNVFGKILGQNSYYRVLNRRERSLDLRELNWPRGYYSVTARMGSQSSNTTVFVGLGKGYTAELRQHKKGLTNDFINERVAFIKTASQLVDKATVFAMILRGANNSKAWRRDYGPWRKGFRKTSHPNLRNIGPKSRNRYVMAEMWLDLKEARKEMDDFTKSMASKAKRTAKGSSRELGTIRNRIQKLHDRAQGLSLWR